MALLNLYEFFAAEYGWAPAYVDSTLTDEQVAVYIDRAGERKAQAALAELDRIVAGTSWGVGIAFEPKNARKWQAIRRRGLRGAAREKGLTGQQLDNAIAAIALADPSLVKYEQAGAT